MPRTPQGSSRDGAWFRPDPPSFDFIIDIQERVFQTAMALYLQLFIAGGGISAKNPLWIVEIKDRPP
jgi:hypothetical protein